jgi:ferric-dicitrate binding protein FerR (iron transport regulator)
MSDIRRGGDQARDDADSVDAQVITPLRNAHLAPDDLQLARLSAALDTALQAVVPKARSPKPPRRRARWVGGLALASAAAAALIAVPSLRRAPPPHPAPERARRPLPIASARGGGAPGVSATVGRPLVVPAGAREQGRVGDGVRFTLVGPAALSAFAMSGGVELDLASGRVLIEYDGNGEDILRVRSPGAVTTVVGTLFAVEARGRMSRVAVARGSVAVEAADARLRQISAGRSWLTEAAETEPIPSDLAAELATHDAGEAQRATPAAPIRPIAAADDDARAEPLPTTGADVRLRRPARPARAARDAEAEYAAVEELMRTGEATAARKALLALVAAHPGDPRADLALLDLARLALAAGHPMEARGHLKKLLSSTQDAALIDLAHQVQRRIDAAGSP